jgi:tRNA-dihydrouridine synthase
LVLRAVKAATPLPVTIKIRTGWDAGTRNAVEVCNIAYNEGITWVAIHGRTRAQNYSGLADWDYIADVKRQVKIPLLGNGDLVTPEQAVLRLQQSGCDGVLIGRGCLKNPNIFLQSLALWRKAEQNRTPNSQIDELAHQENEISLDFVDVFKELSELIHSNCEPHIVNIQLKKFAAWFSSGYPGASQFRKMIFQCKNNDEVQNLALEFFAKLGTLKQDITGDEPFLMGGHG